MKSQKTDNSADLFRSQLSQVLNMSHALVRLSERMNWDKLEAEIDMFYGDGVGQPPLPTRLFSWDSLPQVHLQREGNPPRYITEFKSRIFL